MTEIIVTVALVFALLCLLKRMGGEHPYERWGHQPTETVDKSKIVPPPPPRRYRKKDLRDMNLSAVCPRCWYFPLTCDGVKHDVRRAQLSCYIEEPRMST